MIYDEEDRQIVEFKLNAGGQVVAFADDGTLWCFNDAKWEKIPKLPPRVIERDASERS